MTNYRSATHRKQAMRKSSAVRITLFSSIAAFTWLSIYRDLYFDPRLLLPRDNFYFHYPMFQYVASYLKQVGGIPDWFYAGNPGVALEPLANNFLLLAPHRWIGSTLAAAFSFPLASVYKVSVTIIGPILFVGGIYLFSFRYWHSHAMALAAALVSLTSSVTLIFFFSEQALATVFYLPFFWFWLLGTRRDPGAWIGVASVMGLSLNAHYPQLLLVYYALVFFLGSVFLPRPRFTKATLLLAIAAFTVSASPVLHAYLSYRGDLKSPYREQWDSVEAATYEKYLEVNRTQFSSVEPSNFLFYRGFRGERTPVRLTNLDVNVFFLSPWLPFLFLVGLAIAPYRIFQYGIAASLALLACGTFGPAPQWLWPVLPGANLFRQWYYFLPILNLHLLFVMLAAVFSLAQRRSRLFLYVALAVVALSGLPMAINQMREFRAQVKPNPSPTLTAGESTFAKNLFFGVGQLSLAVPKDLALDETTHLLQQGRLHWRDSLGNMRLVHPGEVTVSLEQRTFHFRLQKPPESGTSLIVTQYDDQRWRGASFEKSAVPGLLQIKAVSQFELRRREAVWIYLVGGMWLPLGLFLAATISRKRFPFSDRNFLEGLRTSVYTR